MQEFVLKSNYVQKGKRLQVTLLWIIPVCRWYPLDSLSQEENV